jgi:hypothetical protein
MNEMRYRFASGVLTGCLVLLGACAVDGGLQGSEQTSTTESAVIVQSCPASYDSFASWSSWAPIDSPYATYCSYGNGQCGTTCDPVPGRPSYCDQQIIPAGDECCNWVPTTEQYTTMQRYRARFNISGDVCVEIDQTAFLTGCGCS